MALFFFDFRQGDSSTPDSMGSEFDSTELAYLEAHKAAEEMWSDLLKNRRDPRRCAFEVRDAERRLLFVLPFLEVVESCKDRHTPTTMCKTFCEATATAGLAKRAGEDFQKELQALRRLLRQSHALLAAPIPDR
jgi:hypothetical protein